MLWNTNDKKQGKRKLTPKIRKNNFYKVYSHLFLKNYIKELHKTGIEDKEQEKGDCNSVKSTKQA